MDLSLFTGKLGEDAVSDYLIKQGFAPVCANYRSRFGEIDVIAADDEYIVFVEVKTRSPGSMTGKPREAVDARKQRKIIQTALLFLAENPTDLQPRFDVAEVYISNDPEDYTISYIANAFDSEAFIEAL